MPAQMTAYSTCTTHKQTCCDHLSSVEQDQHLQVDFARHRQSYRSAVTEHQALSIVAIHVGCMLNVKADSSPIRAPCALVGGLRCLMAGSELVLLHACSYREFDSPRALSHLYIHLLQQEIVGYICGNECPPVQPQPLQGSSRIRIDDGAASVQRVCQKGMCRCKRLAPSSHLCKPSFVSASHPRAFPTHGSMLPRNMSICQNVMRTSKTTSEDTPRVLVCAAPHL